MPNIDLKAALQATLYVAAIVNLFVVLSALPERAVAVLVIAILLPALWWLLYTGLRR